MFLCCSNCLSNFLAIQTNNQRAMLQKFGSKVVCLDATHGTNRQNFLLITLLVVDDRGMGYPVAWLLTKSEDAENMRPFFRALKER